MTVGRFSARLVIVDNHDVVRRGLRAVLGLEPDVTVVGEAGGRRSALEVIAATRPGLVLLDLKLGERGPEEGLELLAELVRLYPSLAVVVFTAFLNQELARSAVRLGARGYVQKDVDAVELMRIIRGVLGGGAGFDPQTARVLLTRPGAGQEGLTEREREILSLVAVGRTNREIAERCHMSESTVKYHIRGLFRHFDVEHRTELARLAGSLNLAAPVQMSR